MINFYMNVYWTSHRSSVFSCDSLIKKVIPFSIYLIKIVTKKLVHFKSHIITLWESTDNDVFLLFLMKTFL